jgi:hypothetical protein
LNIDIHRENMRTFSSGSFAFRKVRYALVEYTSWIVRIEKIPRRLYCAICRYSHWITSMFFVRTASSTARCMAGVPNSRTMKGSSENQ